MFIVVITLDLSGCTQGTRVVPLEPAPDVAGNTVVRRDPRIVHCSPPGSGVWTADETFSCAERAGPPDRTAIWAIGFRGARTRTDACRFLALLAGPDGWAERYQRVYQQRCKEPADTDLPPLPLDHRASFPISPTLACDPWAGTCDVLVDELVAKTTSYHDGARAVLVGKHVEVWTGQSRHVRSDRGAWSSAALPDGLATPVVSGGQIVSLRPTPQAFIAETWNGSAWVRTGGIDGNFHSTNAPRAVVDRKGDIRLLYDGGVLRSYAGNWMRALTPFGNGEGSSIAIDPLGMLVSAAGQTVVWATGPILELRINGLIRAIGFGTTGELSLLADEIVRGKDVDRTDLAWHVVHTNDRVSSSVIAHGQLPQRCDDEKMQRCQRRSQFESRGILADASNREFAFYVQHDMTDVRTCRVAKITCNCEGLDCGMDPVCGGKPSGTVVQRNQCEYTPEGREVRSRITAARRTPTSIEVAELVDAVSNAAGSAVELDASGRIHIAYRRGNELRYRVLGTKR